MITADSNCWGNKTCKNKRSCAVRCGDLLAINANIYDGCVAACNTDWSWENVTTGNQWLCENSNIPIEVLINQYQLIGVCGTTIQDSPLYDEFEKKEEKTEQVRQDQNKIILGLGGILVVLILYLIFG